jgi:MFS family permease
VRADRQSMAPFRVSMFRRLWVSSLLVNLGFLMQMVAASWVILEETGSPAWVSLMLGAPLLPMLFLSLPAGAAADLLDRRRLLAVASAIMAVATLAMAGLWQFGVASPGLLVTLGLVVGVGDALFNPAWQAIVPTVVPIAVLPDAVALNSASGGVATAFGPAIGGVLVATAGAEWAFIAAFVGYLPIVWVLLTSAESGWNRGAGSLGVAITVGLRYLRFSPGYRWLLLVGCLFGFSSAALQSMLPNITQDVLHGGSTLYGVLLGAFGVGAVIGGVSRTWGARLLADRMLPAAIGVYGVVGIAVGVSHEVALTALVIVAAGVMWTWILATLNSTFQALTPDWVRGRTMGAYVLAVFGFKPIGSIASGALGDRIGAAESLLTFSVVMVILAFVVLKLPFPVLEHIEPPELVAPEPGPVGLDDPGDDPAPVMVVTSWTVADAEVPEFLEVLDDLRRMRLSTGAYQWRAYRKVADLADVADVADLADVAGLADLAAERAPDRAQTTISEVYLLHSWDQYVQHVQRVDTRGWDLILRARRYADPQTLTRECFIELDPAPNRKAKRSPT